MQDTAVLNVVGLTPRLLEHAPFLKRWAEQGKMASVKPALPAVTCTVQASFLTGTMPSVHGIVANGWHHRNTDEIRFWLRSGRLIQGEKLWDKAREKDPSFTCANLFWRYAAYSGADHVVIERPMYPADGRKIPDLYTNPMNLRFELQKELGQFPLFQFWGPNSRLASSQWVKKATMSVQKKFAPTLSLVYLPHLDYVLQKEGPEGPNVPKHVGQIDAICKELIEFYEERGVRPVVLSEYGITDVERPVHLNRALRRRGYLAIREEMGGELLDAGASRAFAVADHQIAHIYINDESETDEIRGLVEAMPGVDRVLGEEGKKAEGLDHERSGDLVAVAEHNAWFTYYYWLDDDRAPDFARSVSIHRKPGYDPVELFVDPELRFPKLRVARRLVQKKLGFRYVMDVTPLDATLVKGSHGCLPRTEDEGPLFITPEPSRLEAGSLHATDVHDVLLRHLEG